MNVISKLALTLLLITTCSANAASVWKVSNGQNSVYIGGTIHLLKAESFPLPEEYDKAYRLSDKLIFETDIEAIQTPAFQQKAMAQMILTDGTTLESHLSQETFQALKEYLSSKGIAIQNFQLFKPSAVALTISLLEYQANGFLPQGVDHYYSSKARKEGKPQGWLESVDEQIGFLASIGQGDDENMVKYTLQDLNELPQYLDKILAGWRTGELSELENMMVKDMQQEAPKMYQTILVDRNNNWMPKITQMLQDEQTELVLVGTAHLAGPDSVLNKLKAKGFKVEKL
jgi:uncharacterized protein YbaP (TraB family)